MIIVDTDVLIDIERGRESVKNIIQQFPEENFAISQITMMELYDGLGYTKIKLGVEKYNKKLSIISKIIEDFTKIPINEEIMKKAGIRQGELRAKGVILGREDIIIGMTAEILQATGIMTKNEDHFTHFSVPIHSYKENAE